MMNGDRDLLWWAAAAFIIAGLIGVGICILWPVT